MKRFTGQVNNLKDILLSYSNRTIKTKSPDMWVLWYCTPDLKEFGEMINLLRRFVSMYDLTRKDMEYSCFTHDNIDIETAEKYQVYVMSITLWKYDNGEEKSQRCL